MSSTTDGLKKNHEFDLPSASKRELQPKPIRSCISNILDIPDEILIKIVLHLNARERVALGNSCKRFNSLVFEDEELLRNLDFSKDGRLATASDVQQYFKSKSACTKILGINIRNTGCIEPGRMLNNSIGRARNLVDINIHGIKFLDVWQLWTFLGPLQLVQKLSFDWPEVRESYIPVCSDFLQKPFSRLKSLSVKIQLIKDLKIFIPSLRLCQELGKLSIVVVESSSQTSYYDNWSGKPKELRKLEVVEYCGPLAMQMKGRFGVLLPNPQKWTDFQLDSSSNPKGFYLEIVDVGEELVESKWIERIPNITPGNHLNLGWALIPELLLKEVLRITHENVPEEICCLSTFMDKQRCLLKIDEAKRLLKNPRSHISYIYMDHPLHLGCDVHLVASAFANLTELVLAVVTRNHESFPMDSHFKRRLRRRGNSETAKLNEPLNVDSSLKMLVENTRRLRHFTLGTAGGRNKDWDLEELHLISRWKYLETLRLLHIPIKDGEFLIEIGKQCKDLHTLELIRLGSDHTYCYGEGLLQMLTNCRNLRDFSIEVYYSEVVCSMSALLPNNVHLSRVRMTSLASDHCMTSLMQSIRTLLRKCPKLTTFVGEFRNKHWDADSSDIERWKDEMIASRPNLQIRICVTSPCSRKVKHFEMGTVCEDSPHPNPFPNMWIAN